jgi:hypothetical protein
MELWQISRPNMTQEKHGKMGLLSEHTAIQITEEAAVIEVSPTQIT